MSEQTAGTSFAEALSKLAPGTIVLKAPSGLFYKRVKPTAIATLFDLGELPQTAASIASEEWAKQGVGKSSDELKAELNRHKRTGKRAAPGF